MKALEEKYQNKSSNRKPSWLQSFFILCSGADKEMINEYPTEWNKFAGIGATIFLTACLALLSGGYALHFVFENIWASVFFGIFWAIVIFNLDRYIVLSLRKEKIPTSTDIKRELDPNKKAELKSERSRLLWHQALMASPRFIIALIIAVTVSKPIELRLFQNRIKKELVSIVEEAGKDFDIQEQKITEDLNKQLTSINKQEQDDKSAVFSNNPIYQDAKTKIPTIESNIKGKEQQITSNKKVIDANQYQETRYRTITNQVSGEIKRTSYSVWRPNATGRTKIEENKVLESERQKLLTELAEQKKIQIDVETSLSQQATSISDKYISSKNNIQKQIDDRSKTYEVRKRLWIDANKKSVDLPARLEALGNISKFSFDTNSNTFLGNSIWWASFVITLLFIALETAPIVVKLLTKRGPYDERLDAIEYHVYIEESRKIDSLNREVNEYMKLANEAAKLSGSLKLDAEKDKLDIELRNNKELLIKLADYQKELAEIYADAWFQEEKEKALQQAKGLYQQANQLKPQPKFEDNFWKQIGAVDKIEYCFRNGSISDNELLYFENEHMTKGKWNFISTAKDEIKIELPGISIEYLITELTSDRLKLKEKGTNETIELQKV
ncbi:MAG: hypothetical protein RI952_1470 [Bacteroidota bacterium]|jgi:hypothetical protein